MGRVEKLSCRLRREFKGRRAASGGLVGVLLQSSGVENAEVTTATCGEGGDAAAHMNERIEGFRDESFELNYASTILTITIQELNKIRSCSSDFQTVAVHCTAGWT